MEPISAYVPCFNNAATLLQTIESIRAQTVAVAEIFVVDDGSTDNSVARATAAGVRVIELGTNRGRGTARATAIEAAAHEFVLSCDATMALAVNFAEAAQRHFRDARVAAVYGRVCDKAPQGTLGRWRARHLLKMDAAVDLKRGASLSTWGVLMRKSVVVSVGNFNRELRHSEDAELGQRLLAAGHDVIFEPGAELRPLVQNTLPQLLERYWRWNAGVDEKLGGRDYLRLVWYSLRVLARRDLAARDPQAALVSLLTPHFALWRRLTGRSQR